MGRAVSALGRGPFAPACREWVFACNTNRVTRASANDSTDDDLVALVTLPPLRIVRATRVEVVCEFEFSNSANSKLLAVAANGTGLVGPVRTTSGTERMALILAIPDSLDGVRGTNGSGYGNMGNSSAWTAINFKANSLVITFSARWTTQPIVGELIHLNNFLVRVAE